MKHGSFFSGICVTIMAAAMLVALIKFGEQWNTNKTIRKTRRIDMSNLGIILEQEKNINHNISFLRSKAPLYPEIFYIKKGDQICGTSMVKFTREGVDYIRHHVEIVIETDVCDINTVANRINHAAQQTIAMAVPCKFDELWKTE
jgi:hypothetical protein